MGYNNKEKQRNYNKQWRLANPIKNKIIRDRSYLVEKNKKSQKKYIITTRYKLMNILGGGTKERKLFSSNKSIYLFYIKNPELAKQKLQVLCANCNFIKLKQKEVY